MPASTPFTLLFLLPALLALSACDSGQFQQQAVGMLEWDRAELLAEASEPVLRWRVREGDRVEAGQPLLELDPARRVAQLNQARADRDRAAAMLEEAERGPRKERIVEARARFEGAKRIAEVRRSEYQRRAELLRRHQLSPDAVDQARGELQAAEAERDAGAAALDELLAGTRPEQVEQARQALAQADAAVARAAVDLERLTIRAAVAGRVDSLPLKPGTQPQIGAVAAVLLTSGPYARVYVPETIRVGVHPGDAAQIHVDGVAHAYAGRVRQVESDAVFTPFFALTERDRKRLSYVAKVDFDGPTPDLPAGVPVQVDFAGPAGGRQP